MGLSCTPPIGMPKALGVEAGVVDDAAVAEHRPLGLPVVPEVY
jgi:hypothetical protein